MLEWTSIISGILFGVLRWIEGRLERARTAVDAVVDRAPLRRAGVRIREWMRKDRSGVGGKSDQGGT